MEDIKLTDSYWSIWNKHFKEASYPIRQIKDKAEQYEAIIEVLSQYATFVNVMEDDQLYIYNPNSGIWEDTGAEFVTGLTDNIVPSFNRYDRKEVLSKIKLRCSKPKELFVPLPHIFYFNNTAFNIEDNKPVAFNEHHYATSKFNIDYLPTVTCPNIDKFLEEVQPESNNREALLEILAFCMLKDHRFKKFFIFYGPQDSGKSVWLNVMTEFIGEQNTTHIPIQAIAKGFNISNFENKYGNFVDEISRKPVYDLSTLKNLTGGGYISADRKYRERSNFRSYAKHVFVANERPAIYDDHGATWSRLYQVEFPNIIPSDDMDELLLGKLVTQKELSGLLNQVLMALYVLIKMKKFTHDLSPEEKRNEYLIGTNILPLFCSEMIFEQEESHIDRKELWTQICRYARLRKAKAPTMIMTTKSLPMNIYTFAGTKYIDKKQRHVWYNIAYVPDFDERMTDYETLLKTNS